MNLNLNRMGKQTIFQLMKTIKVLIEEQIHKMINDSSGKIYYAMLETRMK